MAWTGGSNGSSGARMAEAWGGPGGGSWIYTPLPDDRALYPDPAYESAALADLNANVYTYLTGYEPGTTGYPNGVASYPYINNTEFTAVINVISNAELNDPANGIEWMPFYMQNSGTPSRRTQAWAQPMRARMEHTGVPIPPGLKPTYKASTGQPDTDATLIIYLPDWESPGFVGNPAYKGLMINVWGAWDPDANVGRGKPPVWTANQVGYVSGVNRSLLGGAFQRVSGADVTKPNSPGFIGTAPPVGAKNPDGTFVNGDPNNLNQDPASLPGAFGGPIAGHETKTYPGYGRDGIAVETIFETTAAHISVSHHLISRRDCLRTCPIHGHPGYIDHAIGYLLAPERPDTSGGFVHPATGYDFASRAGMKMGTRWRLMPGYYNAANKTGWTPAKHMFVCAWERLGIVFVDTVFGTGTTFRAEPGANGLNGMSLSNALMKTLPWADLRMLSVGTVANPNPTSGTDTTPPTILSRTPAPNATNVPVGATGVSVTFSEAVSGVSGTTFTVSAGSTPIAGAISGSGTVRTFTPSVPLRPSTLYTVNLTAGITDTVGLALAPTSWSFTTGTATQADTTPPSITVRLPAPGEVAVPTTDNISVTFSEPVAGVNGTTFQVLSGSSAVPGTFTPGGIAWTFTPTSPLLENTTYTVQLTSGITDTATPTPNALAPTAWSFTTSGSEATPTVPPARRPRSFTAVTPVPAGTVNFLAAAGSVGTLEETPTIQAEGSDVETMTSPFTVTREGGPINSIDGG